MTTADQIYASLREDQDIINITASQSQDLSPVEGSSKLIGEEQTKAFREFAAEFSKVVLDFCIVNEDSPHFSMAMAMYHGLVIGYRYGRGTVNESDLPL